MIDTVEFTSKTLLTHNGKVTIENPSTGNHRTFRIRTQRKGQLKGKRILGLLSGPDTYTGFAFINDNGSIYVWKKQQSKTNLTYAKMIANPEVFKAKGAVYLFSCKCRVCNRDLTTPESIRSGIGPVCEGR